MKKKHVAKLYSVLLPMNEITDLQLLNLERGLEIIQPNFFHLRRRQLKPSDSLTCPKSYKRVRLELKSSDFLSRICLLSSSPSSIISRN